MGPQPALRIQVSASLGCNEGCLGSGGFATCRQKLFSLARLFVSNVSMSARSHVAPIDHVISVVCIAAVSQQLCIIHGALLTWASGLIRPSEPSIL